MIKSCITCKKEFETQNERKVFCSNACKVFNYRKKNGIDEPKFLKNKIKGNKIEKTREVLKLIPNEIYLGIKEVIEKRKEEVDRLMKSKENSINQLRVLEKTITLKSRGDKLTQSGIDYIFNNKKGTSFADGLLGLGVILLGTEISSSGKKLDIEHGKKILNLKDRINKIDSDINYTLYQMELLKEQIKATPSKIEVKEIEVYYEEIEEDKSLPKSLISLSELKEKTFEVYNFENEYLELLGQPSKSFSAIIYGESGQGKSTWSIKFADYLTKFGKVLYNSSEEGISQSLKGKLLKYESDIMLGSCKNVRELQKILKTQNFDFIFIDSLNDMEIKDNQFEELLSLKKSFIFIMQATKGGNFKGSTKFSHDTDIRIKVENYEAIIEKTRFK